MQAGLGPEHGLIVPKGRCAVISQRQDRESPTILGIGRTTLAAWPAKTGAEIVGREGSVQQWRKARHPPAGLGESAWRG